MGDPELLTAADVLARLGWSARSSLWRAERAGRIRRVRTIGTRPLYASADVKRLAVGARADYSDYGLDDDRERNEDDEELARLRAGLRELLAAGELEDTPTLKLMVAILRRELALRAARGEAVTTGELAQLDKLELRLHHRVQFEELRALTRRANDRAQAH